MTLVWMVPAGHAGVDGLSVSCPERLRPYEEVAISVSVPQGGKLDLFFECAGVRQPLVEDADVVQGENPFFWDVLDNLGEPLQPGSCVLSAVLQANGMEYIATCTAAVAQPALAVQYAVASADTLHLVGGDDFHVAYQLTRAGRMSVTLEDGSGAMIKTWQIEVKDAKPRVFRFDGRLRGKTIDEGRYTLAFTAGKMREPLKVLFEVTAAAPEVLPLEVTSPGHYLPLAMDDASVWAAITAPIAVVDIGALSHQSIRDASGGVVGQIHGQTSGVRIHAIGDDGMAHVSAWRTEDGAYVSGYIPASRLKMVRPNPRYGLLIDKVSQTMTVYAGGKKLGVLPVSTGLQAPKKLFRETAAGAFLTEKRVAAFTSEGYLYEYPIRFDGGNLMHQLGSNRHAGFADHEPLLGSKASHGCVRVGRASIEGEPLSAYWLWTHLPPLTKVLILDDPDQRAAQWQEMFPGDPNLPAREPSFSSAAAPAQLEDSLVGLLQPEVSQTAFPQSSPPPAQPGQTGQITLTFTGDCVLGSEEHSRRRENSFDSFIAREGYAWPFSLVQEYFAADDLTLINLEGVLKDDGRNRQERLHNFRGPTHFADILPLSGIEMVNIANNHHADYGKPGRTSTLQALDGVGVQYAGYGLLAYYEKNGVKIGFGGIRETTWRREKAQMEQDIAALKAQGCDLIIYSCHFGKEYAPHRNALQEEIARLAVDLGADIVIGHHPHVVQGVEHYNGGVIFYSLGNFVFGGNLKLKEFDGCMVQVVLDIGGGAVTGASFRLIPVLTSGAAPDNDFRPVVAAGEDRSRVIARMQADSELQLGDGTLCFQYDVVDGFVSLPDLRYTDDGTGW